MPVGRLKYTFPATYLCDDDFIVVLAFVIRQGISCEICLKKV